MELSCGRIFPDIYFIPHIEYISHRFGTPISADPYKEQFFSGDEGAPRLAVKRLTSAIENQLVENSINAPDW